MLTRRTLMALMAANLKVLAVVTVLIALAWTIWLLISKLFPEVDWLQSGR